MLCTSLICPALECLVAALHRSGYCRTARTVLPGRRTWSQPLPLALVVAHPLQLHRRRHHCAPPLVARGASGAVGAGPGGRRARLLAGRHRRVPSQGGAAAGEGAAVCRGSLQLGGMGQSWPACGPRLLHRQPHSCPACWAVGGLPAAQAADQPATAPLPRLQEVAAAHDDLVRVLEQGVVICAERTPPSQFDHKSYLLTVSCALAAWLPRLHARAETACAPCWGWRCAVVWATVAGRGRPAAHRQLRTRPTQRSS